MRGRAATAAMPVEARPAPPVVLALSATAIARYLARGWRITPHGRPDAGITTGPCARCRAPHHLYGPGGHPLCGRCRSPT